MRTWKLAGFLTHVTVVYCQKIQCNFPQCLLCTWCHELIEFDWYMNILGPQFVNTNQDLDSIITFWKSIQHRVPASADVAKPVFAVFLTLRAQSEATVFKTLYFTKEGHPYSQKLLNNWFSFTTTIWRVGSWISNEHLQCCIEQLYGFHFSKNR